MNVKRCKELRRNLREQGIAVGEVRYLQPTRRGIGSVRVPFGTRTLDPRCGRAVYRAAKKAGAV